MKNQLIGFPRVFSFTMRMTTGAEACPSRSMMEALCRFCMDVS